MFILKRGFVFPVNDKSKRSGLKSIVCLACSLSSSSSSSSSSSCLCVGADIVYENGAVVNTSFVTNLESCQFRTVPSLYLAIKQAVDKIRKEQVAELPKYKYPSNVVTSTSMNQLSKYGQEIRVERNEAYFVRALDSQKEKGKTIYGAGYLISEKAAAEKAAATSWELSEREKEIIKQLGK